MSVVLETTLGDITIDLYIDQRPKACLNFLKLCKIKYYNFNLFHTVNNGFIAQTGDPTGSGNGGESIWGVMDGPEKRYFEAETSPRIKHTTTGLVSFVGDQNMVGSQFFITLAPDLTYLDAQHCVFGEVVEGFDVLRLLNDAICDNEHRPYQDIRITHTVILEDPFPDPDKLVIPDASPEATAERLQGGRIAPDEVIDETEGKSAHEVMEIIAEKEAKARATILEMIGDIPDAEMAPPENVLFVCKLNPVTNDDDLEIIFSRFGKIKSCEVIRDKKTGDSLQYAFVEFETQKACEDAYFKMDNVLIDDRRIHVDFSQSVAKVKWLGKGRGVTHFNEKGEKRTDDPNNDVGNGRYRSQTNHNQNKNKDTSRNRQRHNYKTEDKRNENRYRKSRSKSKENRRFHRHDNYKRRNYETEDYYKRNSVNERRNNESRSRRRKSRSLSIDKYKSNEKYNRRQRSLSKEKSTQRKIDNRHRTEIRTRSRSRSRDNKRKMDYRKEEMKRKKKRHEFSSEREVNTSKKYGHSSDTERKIKKKNNKSSDESSSDSDKKMKKKKRKEKSSSESETDSEYEKKKKKLKKKCKKSKKYSSDSD